MTRGAEREPKKPEAVRSTYDYRGEPLKTLRVAGEGGRGGKLIIAPGLGETSDNFLQTAGALAERGHEVHVLSPRLKYDQKEVTEEFAKLKERTKTFYKKLDPGIFEAIWGALPMSEVAKAFALIAYTESARSNEAERVRAIGHSQGGANLLIAAFLRPDLFQHIVLVNPAGQSGKEKMGGLNGLFSRFFRSLLTEGNKPGKRHLIAEAAIFLACQGFFLKFHKSRAMKEAYALAAFNAFPLLYALQHAEPPVARTTVYDSGDPVFRQEDIERAEKDASEALGVGANDQPFGARVVTEDLGHYHPVTHPKKFAALVDGIVS